MSKEKKDKELTYQDIQLRNIVYVISVLVLIEVVFNWDKILSFLEWITNL